MCAAFAAAPDLRAFKSGWLTPAQALAINSDAATLARFAQKLPKAELHIHIEGGYASIHDGGRCPPAATTAGPLV